MTLFTRGTIAAARQRCFTCITGVTVLLMLRGARLRSAVVGSAENFSPGFYEDSPEPDDLGMAWDAAEKYAVALLWQALPEVRSVPAPDAETGAAARRIRSAIRKWPYRQLARIAWGRARPPADDTQLWLDAAGAIAAMRDYVDVDAPSLAPLSLLRPADWTGAVIGVVRSGVNAAVGPEDLVRYARECARATAADEPAADEPAYDPFASVTDDQSLLRAFEALLTLWEAVGAVSSQFWLTGLGWWGLPRALARAWNQDFDEAEWIDTAETTAPRGRWAGDERDPEELGIHRPPIAY